MPSPKMFNEQITFKTTTEQRCALEAIQIVKNSSRLSDPLRELVNIYLAEYVAKQLTAEQRERYQAVYEQRIQSRKLTSVVQASEKLAKKRKAH